MTRRLYTVGMWYSCHPPHTPHPTPLGSRLKSEWGLSQGSGWFSITIIIIIITILTALGSQYEYYFTSALCVTLSPNTPSSVFAIIKRVLDRRRRRPPTPTHPMQ